MAGHTGTYNGGNIDHSELPRVQSCAEGLSRTTRTMDSALV